MRKTDQELMWQAFTESVNGGPGGPGGPLKASGGSSSFKSGNTSEDAEDVDGDPYEDEEDELQGILKKCQSGELSPDEARKHINKLMKGAVEAEEDGEDENEMPIKKAVRRPWAKPAPGKSTTREQRLAKSNPVKRDQGQQYPQLRTKPDQKDI